MFWNKLFVSALFGLFIVAFSLVLVNAEFEGDLEVLNRTATVDDYRNVTSNITFMRVYSTEVNLPNLTGSHLPYTQVTNLSANSYNMSLVWNDRSVVFDFYTKNESGYKEYLSEKSQQDIDDLELITSIFSFRSSYHYTHNMTSNLSLQPYIFGYDFILENTDCSAQNYTLLCDEQAIYFQDAVLEQNLSVNLTQQSVEFSGNDLSYIDPTTRIKALPTNNGATDEIEKFCDPGPGHETYEYEEDRLWDIGTEDSPSNTEGKNTRGWIIFDLDKNLPTNVVTVTDVNLTVEFTDIDNVDCSNVDIELRRIDGENYDMNPNTEPLAGELYEAIDDNVKYAEFANLEDEDEGLHTIDLGEDAVVEVQQNLNGVPDDDFIIGIFSNDEQCPGEVCDVDIEDLLGPNPPYIDVRYTAADITPPNTTATATSPPGGASYAFGTTANKDVEITLSCLDTGGDPGPSGCDVTKYCINSSDNCEPVTTYSSPFTIMLEGTHYVRFRSIDNAGNVELIQSRTVVIDKDFPTNPAVYVNGLKVWEHGGSFQVSDVTDNFAQELQGALANCAPDSEGYCDIPIVIHTDTAGIVNVSDINIYFETGEYFWNISSLAELSTYRTRVSATDGMFNTSWDESDSDFKITKTPIGAPGISFVSPTPANESLLNATNTVGINLSTQDSTDDHYTFVNFDEDLVLWIRMDDRDLEGNPLDLSSYSNNGSLEGDAYIDSLGYFGNTGQFSGSSGSQIRIPNSDSLRFTANESFSISTWVYVPSLPNAWKGIITKSRSSGTWYGLWIKATNNKWVFGGQSNLVGSTAQTGWNHIVLVQDGKKNKRKIFLNGVLDIDTGSAEDANGTGDLIIGSSNFSTENFNGSVDEVIIFNRALSIGEVQSLYNSTAYQYYNEFSDLDNGNYVFTGHAVDTEGNRNQTEERQVTIELADLNAPSISFVNPTPSNGSSQSSTSIFVNISSSDLEGSDHYTFTDFNSDLILWDRMDDVSGNNIIDLSSHNHNGTLRGNALIGSGIYGDALNLDGNNSYVFTNVAKEELPDSEITITAWVKPDVLTGDNFRSIITTYTNNSGGYGLRLIGDGADSGKLQFYYRSAGTWHDNTNGTTSLPLNEWSFVAVTYDGNSVKLYVNGAEDASYTNSDPLIPMNDLTIGSLNFSNNGVLDYWDGSIDEVLMFNRALSAGEVSALYNASANQYSHEFAGLSNGQIYHFVGHSVDVFANRNQTETRTVEVSAVLNIPELKVVYQNLTERVFRFVINNSFTSSIAGVSWTLDTGESNITAEQNASLQSGEDLDVYVYHNYTSSGNYTIIASATNGTYSDERSIQIEV